MRPVRLIDYYQSSRTYSTSITFFLVFCSLLFNTYLNFSYYNIYFTISFKHISLLFSAIRPQTLIITENTCSFNTSQWLQVFYFISTRRRMSWVLLVHLDLWRRILYQHDLGHWCGLNLLI